MLKEENGALRLKVVSLERLLQEALDKLNKNSSNSSKPPSTDIKRTKSLRVGTGKKAGGQPGHRGNSLPMSIAPDKIIMHRAESCRGCGKDLRGVGGRVFESRQVYDIPPLRMEVTEHRSEVKCCPHCQTENRGGFPPAIAQHTQYGSNIKQLAVYLTQYQLLPYGRGAQLIGDITGHRISVGAMVNINTGCGVQLSGFMEALKSNLRQSPLVHCDETGYYFEGLRNWLHVATTEDCTFYYPHEKRGSEAMGAMGILPGYKGIIVHDFWKSYLDYGCAHALCNVHHLRDLTFCEEQEKSGWAKDMKALLLEMKQAADDCKAKALGSMAVERQNELAGKYDTLMVDGAKEHPLPEKQACKRGVVKKTKTQNLIQRFTNHKEDILRFIKDLSVPFGNNIAEQAIRMMKLKQKISGCFRSKDGATAFANTRSYIDTMRKNGHSIMDAIALAIDGKPIFPFQSYTQSG